MDLSIEMLCRNTFWNVNLQPLSLTTGCWRQTASRCAQWTAPGGTVAPPWCPAPPPPLTSPTWRRTRGFCGDGLSTSGRMCARRRRSSSRWGQGKWLPVERQLSLVQTCLRAYCDTAALGAYCDTSDLTAQEDSSCTAAIVSIISI